jgi:hypothetical protein
MLIVGAMLFTVPAYAADDPTENLAVDAVWLEGDMLHIEVTDRLTGINQTLMLPLDEYASGSEYVSVQAVDRNGNKSNTIQFKNPFHTPDAEKKTDPIPYDPAQTKPPEGSEPAIPDGWKPFTPDGTGTVIDNVTDGDGKEFFSIETPDGNVFYLIVDRQRQTDNVYLLNAVTEDDLTSLAKEGNGTAQGGIHAQTPPQAADPGATEKPEPEPPVPPASSGGMNSGTIIFILIAAAAAGGAGYYFKILKPKKQAGIGGEDDYDEDDDSDYEDEGGGDPGEGGDGE